MIGQHQEAKFFGWKNAALLFFIYLLGIGMVFYGYSVIFPAMIKATGWARGTASAAYSINAVLTSFLAPVLAIFIGRYGTKKAIIFGMAALLLVMLLLGTVTTQLWIWLVIWGFVAPFGRCFGGIMSVQANVMLWFNVRRATVLGIVMTGAAVGGAIAQPTFTRIIGQLGSWRSAWLAAAALVFIGLVLSWFIKDKPQDLGQHPDGLDPEEAEKVGGQPAKTPKTYRTQSVWPLKQVVRTWTLWLLIIVVMY